MNTVKVLTSRSIETMLQMGGSGDWKADKNKLSACRYIINVRNRKTGGTGGVAHGTAFMIGKISGVTPSYDGRYVVNISEYAEINIPGMWDGNQNPVAYINIEDIKNLDPDKLEWKKFELPEKFKKEKENEKKPEKIRHIVMWNFNANLTPEMKQAASKKIKAELEALKDIIDGIIELKVAVNMLPASNGEIVLNSLFVNEDALNAYQKHPDHKHAGAFVASVTRDRRCVDYEEVD